MAVDAWGRETNGNVDAWGKPVFNGGANASIDQWGRPTYTAGSGTPTGDAFGNVYPSYLTSGQQNVMLGNQREDSIANFVARMQRPQDTAMNQQFAGDVGKYGGALDAQIAKPLPTMETGNRFEAGLGDAESRLKALLDNPDSINQSAAYKFRVGQGQEALQRSLGAKGMLNSGNRLMDLTKYGQDMASQEYDNQFGRVNGLVSGYAGSWLGDKNANTSRFAAESAANNARTGTLADLYKGAGTTYNTNTSVGSEDRTKWGNVWNGKAPNQQQWSIANRW